MRRRRYRESRPNSRHRVEHTPAHPDGPSRADPQAAAVSRFLAVARQSYDPERLKVLQSVYDWLEDIVPDKNQLELAILALPNIPETFDQVLEHVSKDLGLLKAAGGEKLEQDMNSEPERRPSQ